VASEASAWRDTRAGPPTEAAWYWPHAAVPGVDLLRARYVTHRYARHAHETYTLALIEDGVEEFSYGGTLLRAPKGSVALLNPEVAHTGQAAVPEGWASCRGGGSRASARMRAFRAETGMPPHAYLNQLRVRQARVRLDRGLPPAEAAAKTGFADQAHLTRHFKRVVGVPPGAFQRARGVVRQ
jgi:Helix-turn-helix domain/AraC-like ligand binding domain